MPLSSYLGGSSNPRRGWAHSILPSSSNKSSSKHRKTRRRGAVKDFLTANFFAVGLSISLLLFIFIIYIYGVPRPISSHFVSYSDHTSRGGGGSSFIRSKSKIIYRKTVDHGGGGVAAVDMTTKELYDKIDFNDVDGGPWKQGWKVTYNGDEWDSEKLKVFVVPHSHNDPGWKLTVEEYYDRQSRHILDTIVDTLSKDVRRKFIWEEMSYLERWWKDAGSDKREAFTNLVHNGQLEIVGGGWVMNDENYQINGSKSASFSEADDVGSKNREGRNKEEEQSASGNPPQHPELGC